MITYALGNIPAKRRAFKAAACRDTVYIDNDEVAATFTLDKRLYVISGSVPYSNMSIEQYVTCHRALKTGLPIGRAAVRDMLFAVGLTGKTGRRLKRLTCVEYRAAALAAKTDENTQRIFVSFDGLSFTRKNERLLSRFVKIWEKSYEVFVSVSDSRFVPKNAPVITYNGDNTFVNTVFRPKKIRMSVLRRRLKKSGLDLRLPRYFGVLSITEH